MLLNPRNKPGTCWGTVYVCWGGGGESIRSERGKRRGCDSMDPCSKSPFQSLGVSFSWSGQQWESGIRGSYKVGKTLGRGCVTQPREAFCSGLGEGKEDGKGKAPCIWKEGRKQHHHACILLVRSGIVCPKAAQKNPPGKQKLPSISSMQQAVAGNN